MKTVAFHLHVEQNIWRYEDMQLQELEKQEWLLTVGNEIQIYESIYAAIDELAKMGLHSTFRLPDDMENIPSKCR